MSFSIVLFGILLVTLSIKMVSEEENLNKLRAASANFFFGLFCILFGLTLVGIS